MVPFAGAGISATIVPTWVAILHWIGVQLVHQKENTEQRISSQHSDNVVDRPTKEDFAEFQEELNSYGMSAVQFTQDLMSEFGPYNFKAAVKAIIEKSIRSSGIDSMSSSKNAVHAALLTGPFPAIVTTNWDDVFERTWEESLCVGDSSIAHSSLC